MLATFFLTVVLSAAPADTSDEPQLDFAIEQAAREFRITVYERYHGTRDEFDARRALGKDLLKSWNKAEQPPRHREAVLAWFKDATHRSRFGQPLLPYSQLEDLKTTTVSEELPPSEGAAPVPSKPEIKLPPPFMLDVPQADVKPAEAVELWERLKGLFGGKAAPAVEPAAAK